MIRSKGSFDVCVVFHKALLKFTRPSRPHSDRAMAIGCYAEVLNEVCIADCIPAHMTSTPLTLSNEL
jgi:hypothetical protein